MAENDFTGRAYLEVLSDRDLYHSQLSRPCCEPVYERGYTWSAVFSNRGTSFHARRRQKPNNVNDLKPI